MLKINDDFHHSDVMDPIKFLDHIDNIRSDFQKSLNKEHQLELGQFMTRPSIVKMMAGMYNHFPKDIYLLDPGAGVGSLSAGFISKIAQVSPKPEYINVHAYEVDPTLVKGLRKTLEKCQEFCNFHNIQFQYEIRQEDFIASSIATLSGRYSLFPVNQPNYNYAILNPPYKKISSSSRTRRLLNIVGIETTNMYSAFLWLVFKLLLPSGEVVAIVPRSFCNGTYFRPFRSDLLRTMSIDRIHIFESRDKAFNDSEVLQENIIVHLKKTSEHNQMITITSNDNPDDEDIITREIEYDQMVQPGDPDLYIRIIPDQLGEQISTQINGLSSSLKDLGITVSTGRVVDFRSKALLRYEPSTEIIPLIYPNNFQDGLVNWPIINSKKPSYLSSSIDVNNLVITGEYYVFVKRFSSKEERRRICAALFDPKKVSAKRIGIENHINYYHRRYGGLSKELAKGLTIYLNSSIVDQYFRQFSGHTQVNATDLRNLKYPNEIQLLALGRRIGDKFPNQDEIDNIVTEELALSDKNVQNGIPDPILAKKKIKEALNILKLLNVPRTQQNDRSALTLLALVNIRARTDWRDASENLIGITEMMDYFRENYGINYAPNTRETVRRQTIHQFIQLGLVVENPDDPTRPINSPKTRYVIEPNTLELIKTYGTSNWQDLLLQYIRKSPSISALQVRERSMPMIPVTLPGGDNLTLSSGGQNELIKKILEDFCPRFTPGGVIIYIGDAKGKLNEKEILYFEQMGFIIDRHGKMPDVIVLLREKKWLVLIEAVTSHGPIDQKRHNELCKIFKGGSYGLVFVTAFESRKAMHKFLSDIAWETEVWVSEAPSHLIHFNGEKFLGPY